MKLLVYAKLEYGIWLPFEKDKEYASNQYIFFVKVWGPSKGESGLMVCLVRFTFDFYTLSCKKNKASKYAFLFSILVYNIMQQIQSNAKNTYVHVRRSI